MKKFLFLVATILLIAACSQPSTYTVNATVDMEDGKKVYLIRVGEGNRPEPIDTIDVVNGAFSFSDSIVVPEMHYLFFEDARGNLPVVLEPGTIQITAYKDSLRASTVKGTSNNKDFADYISETKQMGADLNKIQLEMRTATMNRDSLLVEDLRLQFDEMLANLTAYEMEFMKLRTGSYISALILERMLMGNSLETEEAKPIFEGFSKEVKTTQSGKNIFNKLYPEAVEKTEPTAEIAPDFTAPTPEGGRLNLMEVASKSKVTMIDFWASWCSPCRVESPRLVRLYERFHDKGLEIVGVSLDKDLEKWTQAILDDKLNWNHVSNLKYWQDPVAELYGVRAIPSAFLIDNQGNILAKDLRGEDLESKLESLLL